MLDGYWAVMHAALPELRYLGGTEAYHIIVLVHGPRRRFALGFAACLDIEYLLSALIDARFCCGLGWI